MAVRDIIASEEAQPTRLKMSYEEFLEWSNEDTHAEWDASTGEVIIFMPPKNIHQATLMFLSQLLDIFVRLFDLGKVGIAPFEVKLKPSGSSREPDIFFWLRPTWLWQVDTLTPLTCALEIEGVAAALTQQIQQVQSKGDE